jgi:hypothetical protein
VDLLDFVYHWSFRDHHEARSAFTHPRSLVYRAAWPSSQFCLIAEGDADVELEMTARLPVVERPRAEDVAIAVDGTVVTTARVGPTWTRVRARLGRLRPGINRLSVRWPSLPREGDAAVEQVASRLEQGIPADLHPVFGELFRLRARTR